MANLPNDPTKHNGHYAHHYATKYNNGNLYGILPTTTDAYHGNGLPPRGSCEDPRFVARRKRPSKLTWFRQVNLINKILFFFKSVFWTVRPNLAVKYGLPPWFFSSILR